jgi:hypothetical protein
MLSPAWHNSEFVEQRLAMDIEIIIDDDDMEDPWNFVNAVKI